MMRLFMGLIRWGLGKIILFWDSTFPPRPLPSCQRSGDDQKRVDEVTRGLVLYQFEACPFCVKVRRALRRMNLQIELRDARKVPAYGEELLQGGGSVQVPCLKIPEADGSYRWLYESSDIIAYLEKRFIFQPASQ